MNKYEIEPHHIIFAIASVITAMLFSIFWTSSNLGSLMMFIILLLVTVQLLSVMIGAGLFELAKEFYHLITRKHIGNAKKPLESGDIVLNAAVITTGAIVLETYNFIKIKYPALIIDEVNAVLIVAGISIVTFMGTYYFYREFSLI